MSRAAPWLLSTPTTLCPNPDAPLTRDVVAALILPPTLCPNPDAPLTKDVVAALIVVTDFVDIVVMPYKQS